jgi:hypothetical protein
VLTHLAKGLLGRLLGYGAVALGFWLLFRGFSEAGFPLAILGGVTVLVGMYLLVGARRSGPFPRAAYLDGDKEDDPSDSIDGSGESNQLPP